jgi:glycerol uptake operon antiterminator
MTNTELIEIFEQNPVIAAVRTPKMLDIALSYNVQVVFFLSGSICTLAETFERLNGAGRTVFLHLDLVEGLHADHSGVEFVARNMPVTGIISTKPTTIRLAQAQGLKTIQRSFLLDTAALKTSIQNTSACRPDLVEVLPGVSPEIVSIGKRNLGLPIIAGGFVREKKELFAALGAGAIAVSTSEPALWGLNDE